MDGFDYTNRTPQKSSSYGVTPGPFINEYNQTQQMQYHQHNSYIQKSNEANYASTQYVEDSYDRRGVTNTSLSSQTQDADTVKIMKTYFDLIVNKMTNLDERLNNLESNIFRLVRAQRDAELHQKAYAEQLEIEKVRKQQEQLQKDMEIAKALQEKEMKDSMPKSQPNITDICPICQKRFPKSEIEDHAIACLDEKEPQDTKTKKAEPKKPEERQNILMRIFGPKKVEPPKEKEKEKEKEVSQTSPPPVVPEMMNSGMPMYYPQMPFPNYTMPMYDPSQMPMAPVFMPYGVPPQPQPSSKAK